MSTYQPLLVQQIPEEWAAYVASSLSLDLELFLNDTTYFPKDVFAAFRLTPLPDVKVVIIGQDPYHNGQANGLAFSVDNDQPSPPSLRNIQKEIKNEFDYEGPADLRRWAENGVFLLNTVLTVAPKKARSHAGKGWEEFTDQVIRVISDQREGVVFMLWGGDAHQKEALIDESKHLVLKTSHPSPLSAHRGFLGCNHFIQANQYLGGRAIRWHTTQREREIHKLAVARTKNWKGTHLKKLIEEIKELEFDTDYLPLELARWCPDKICLKLFKLGSRFQITSQIEKVLASQQKQLTLNWLSQNDSLS